MRKIRKYFKSALCALAAAGWIVIVILFLLGAAIPSTICYITKTNLPEVL